jgi:hypothetical protein
VLLGRVWFFVLLASLFGAALGACHEPNAPSSGTPLNGARPESPSLPSGAIEAQAQGGAGSGSEASGGAAVGGRPGAFAVDASSSAAAGGRSGALAVDSSSSAPASADSSTIPAGDVALALVDAHGNPLPQTDERPSVTAVAFRQRIAAVAAAIISGHTEPALDAFFPLVAYAQVKDVSKPERDYKFRLLANFKRDVLEYHHALGAEAAQAQFTGITVSEKDARWMGPGSEGNKLGYYRVLRSRLHFALPAGRNRDFELTSLISWRGEWYVVHLHGFK